MEFLLQNFGADLLCSALLGAPLRFADSTSLAPLFDSTRNASLLDFARRVAALPAPPSGLASCGWSFFIAVFLAAPATAYETVSWLQQFPHRFALTHPEVTELFGRMIRARIQQYPSRIQQHRSSEFVDVSFFDLVPVLLCVVHETRTCGSCDVQIITAASNVASLLFAVRISGFTIDLSGCVLEDCNFVAADFTNVTFKSDEHGEAQLRECVVEEWVAEDDISEEAKQLLERGKRAELKKTLVGHAESVRSVAFSPDMQLVGSGSWDKTVKVWDATTGTCVDTLDGHTNWVNSVAFSPDGNSIVSGSEDTTVKVWDLATSSCFRTLSGHTRTVTSVAFSPDGKRIVSGSRDRTVKVWEAATGTCIQTFAHHNWVRSVAFSPDGKSIVSGGSDDAVKVWDAATGNCIRTLSERTSIVSSVAFSPDGKIVVDSTFINCVAFSPDGKGIVGGGDDKIVSLWETTGDRAESTFLQVLSVDN